MSDKQISVVADYDGTWDGKWLCADSPLPPGTGPYKLIPYIRADLHEALRAENARLREALATYADEANWQQTSEANGDPWDGNVRDLWDGEDENGWDIARAALRAIAEGDA